MKRLDSAKKISFIILFASIIGLAIRIPLFSYQTGDFNSCLSAWMQQMDTLDGIKRFGISVGDYTCFYNYVLAIITLLPVNRLYAIKAFSVLFDFFLSYFVFDLVNTITKDKTKAALSYLVAFLCPTVIMNSAVWAQCDAIFTTFLLGTLSFILRDKPIKASIMYGIAFAIKLQSIFIAPLFICLWLKKRVKIRHLFCIPLVYCLFTIPAIIVGKNLRSAFTVYLHQSSEYKLLCMNAPSIWGFAQDLGINNSTPFRTLFGIGITGLAVLIILISVYKTKSTVSNFQWLDLACIFSVIIPFLLPRMHERYFYIADIFSIVYAFGHRKRWYVPILTVSASAFSYLKYLTIDLSSNIINRFPMWIASLFVFIALTVIIIGYHKDYYKEN